MRFYKPEWEERELHNSDQGGAKVAIFALFLVPSARASNLIVTHIGH